MSDLEWRNDFVDDPSCSAFYADNVRVGWIADDCQVDMDFAANYRLAGEEWKLSTMQEFKTREEAETFIYDAVLPQYLPTEMSA